VIAIPESADTDHVRANRAAADLVLDDAAMRALEHAFPPPSGPAPLAML
jgi:diketogulonate reductase-like aldo/keto reductase